VGGLALSQMVVEGKLDMSVGAFFEPAPEIRRTPLFRFSLMVIRPDDDPALRRTMDGLGLGATLERTGCESRNARQGKLV
jgi:hypothetical protein